MLSNYLSYFSRAIFCIISVITGIKFEPIIPLVVRLVYNNLFFNFYDVSSPTTRVAHALPHF